MINSETSEFLSNNSNCFTVSTTNNITFSGNGSEILDWLSPLDPRNRHRNIQAMRVENVGDWFLQAYELGSWCDDRGEGAADGAVLFCCGDLSVGKTFISSQVIDKFCDQARRQNTVIVCFYLDIAAQEEQSPTNTMGCLLKQLVVGLEKIPDEVFDAFQDSKMAIGGRAPQFAQITNLFQTVTSLQRTIICIDALDECSSRNRLKLLGSLRDIVQRSPGTRIFLTGRPHIRSEIEKKLGAAVTVVPIVTQKCDIRTYICARLDEDPTPDAMDSSLKLDIVDIFNKTMPMVMRAVSLKMDEILGETTISGRRRRLSAMTEANIRSYNANITGSGLTQYIPPGDGNLPSSPKQHPQPSTLDPHNSSNVSYSQPRAAPLSKIDPVLTQGDCPTEHPHQNPSTSTPPEAFFDQLTGATSNSALLTNQNDLPVELTGIPTTQAFSSPLHDPYFLQYYAIQEPQQLAGSPWGQCLDPTVNSRVSSSPSPPGQPVPHHRERITLANHSRPGPYRCVCGVMFLRLMNLDRHVKTSRKHRDPHGPGCPEHGCKYTSRFTRVDNFKAHYRRVHGKTNEEANRFIKKWKNGSKL